MSKNKTPLGDCGKQDDGRWMIRVVDQVYLCDAHYDASIIRSLRRIESTGVLVVDRPRDFGGCGKDAVKMEVNVPVVAWLQEIFASKAKCFCCDDEAATFDLAPVCRACSLES